MEWYFYLIIVIAGLIELFGCISLFSILFENEGEFDYSYQYYPSRLQNFFNKVYRLPWEIDYDNWNLVSKILIFILVHVLFIVPFILCYVIIGLMCLGKLILYLITFKPVYKHKRKVLRVESKITKLQEKIKKLQNKQKELILDEERRWTD